MDFSNENMNYKAEYFKILPIKHNNPPPDCSDDELSDDFVVKMIKEFKETEIRSKSNKKITKK